MLTYGFVHFGVAHLLTNLVALGLAGPVLERGIGGLGAVVVFLVGVFGAGAAVFAWGAPGYVVGASGGAMAVIAAAVVVAVLHPVVRGTRTSAAALRAAGGLAIAQFTFDALVPRVSLTAHLGGALVGLALGVAWVTIRPRR